jgi:predicted Zn finger-like uncharacterized protein
MLFTRCPECETTFRVTDDTLKKANGQVRCGRCASVFNAYAELRDPNAKSFDRTEAAPVAPPSTAAAPQDLATPPALITAPIAPPTAAEPVVAQAPATPPALGPEAEPVATAPPDPVAASLGIDSVADIVAQVEQGSLAERASEASAPSPPSPIALSDDDAQADEPISAREVDAVLTTPVVVPPQRVPWSPFGTPSVGAPDPWRSRWAIAAGVAFLLLALQVLDHFRTELAGNSTVGGWVQGAYSLFGIEVRPRWDVNQYEIVEWIANAEPNARGLGSLKITAHIMNRGPARQPFPSVQLELKDRWEDAVGRRLFTPDEYLPRDAPRARMMAPGETTRAEIEVIDPGPDAYGFELDVCVEVEASSVSCRTDEVFLSTR